MAKTYIVLKCGVYMRDVYGPLKEEPAKLMAFNLALADRDSYHDYRVYQLSEEGFGDLTDHQPLVSYRKEQVEKIVKSLITGGRDD